MEIERLEKEMKEINSIWEISSVNLQVCFDVVLYEIAYKLKILLYEINQSIIHFLWKFDTKHTIKGEEYSGIKMMLFNFYGWKLFVFLSV